MINRTVARRYAAALFQAAAEAGQEERVEEGLARVAQVLNEQPQLRLLVENRRLARQVRKEALVQAAGPEPAPLLVNALKLLIDKQREAYVRDIHQEYRQAALAARNMAEAQVTSAVELEPETVESIRVQLEELTGLQLQMVPHVDPDMVGGIRVRIGDRRFDGSLRRQLRELGDAIAGRGGRQGKGVLAR